MALTPNGSTFMVIAASGDAWRIVEQIAASEGKDPAVLGGELLAEGLEYRDHKRTCGKPAREVRRRRR